MEVSFLTQWFSDHAIKAICWTLIHSLWIGIISALLAGLLISFTRKSSTRIRYMGLCGILVLFVMAIGLTYYCQVRTTDAGTPANNTDSVTVNDTDVVTINHVGALPQQGIVSQAVGFLNQNMNIIFLVWLFLFMLKSLKMAGGLLYIQRIRHYRVHSVAEELMHKIEMFSSQIGVRQTVRLMQSELVKVPVTVGWLKPVILLPMGIILQLPADQLESILWHELAHIRRRDYLVNILQGLVETFFFFNPGLLWLSSLIRAEREACCDDIVLSRMNRKANYLEALLALSYGENSRAPLAIGIGSGNQLRERLERIVNQENKRLSAIEKVVLVAGLALLLIFTTISKGDPVIEHFAVKSTNGTTPTAPEKQPIVLNDTAVHFTSTSSRRSGSDSIINDITSEDKNGRKYHLIIAGNKLVAMDINGKKVKDNSLPEYEYMIGLFREREKAYAAVLAAKFNGDKEPGKQHYMDSLLRKP